MNFGAMLREGLFKRIYKCDNDAHDSWARLGLVVKIGPRMLGNFRELIELLNHGHGNRSIIKTMCSAENREGGVGLWIRFTLQR